MCGRYTFLETKDLKERFQLLNEMEELSPRYNAAPGQILPVIIREGVNQADMMRWGLVPHWAKDPKIGNRMINARAETLLEKPTWKESFLYKRCLIPANGFFEWQHQNGNTPYYLKPKEAGLFSFAGLTSLWLDAESHPLKTFAIITTQANELVGTLHDRMPVILKREDESTWLNHTSTLDELHALLQPYPAAKMTLYPVNSAVNNPRNDDETILKALR